MHVCVYRVDKWCMYMRECVCVCVCECVHMCMRVCVRLLANKQLQDTAPHLAISSHPFSSLSQNSWSARCFCSCRLNSSAHSPLLPGATTCKVGRGTSSNITRKSSIFLFPGQGRCTQLSGHVGFFFPATRS